MDKNEIRQTIINALNDNGICPQEADDLEKEIMKMDSLTYVSFMVDLESELGVEMDELLVEDLEKTYAEFIECITEYVEKKLSPE